MLYWIYISYFILLSVTYVGEQKKQVIMRKCCLPFCNAPRSRYECAFMCKLLIEMFLFFELRLVCLLIATPLNVLSAGFPCTQLLRDKWSETDVINKATMILLINEVKHPFLSLLPRSSRIYIIALYFIIIIRIAPRIRW